MRTLLARTNRIGIATIFALIFAAHTLAAPAGAATTGSTTARAAEAYRMAPSFDERVLYWTNVARRQHGRAPLRLMSCLDGYATSWSRRMAASDWMRHQSLSPILRNCHRSAVAENIGWGSSGLAPRQIVRMWMRSPSHRANILHRGYRYIGLGAFRSADTGRVYATQDFGR